MPAALRSRPLLGLIAAALVAATPFTGAFADKVMRVGMIWADFAIVASVSRRGSGTATSPTLGSMVQNG